MDFKRGVREKTAPASYTSDMARRLAYGSYHEESGELRHILGAIEGCFEPKHKPGPNDWLSLKVERGQTFKQYHDLRRPISESRQTIYIQPLEDGQLPA